ncbi:MAG: hypothetical protein J0I42_02785 [Bosea sp.]|uniref:hypothetical protein n=1 Tax=Bosea sp. (in: a-proteobacteria) TaxID=1871050 RepID=UPI001ACCB9A8|nr:hypothetical protein [Bosea sp. (in: a-proteobacteria)]MBN9450854.1 hypothetical protein [Bosea sp. (in: a-proteobacteria)]
MIDQTLRQGRWLALPLLCLGLAGCGSGSSSSAGNTALNVIMFQSTTPPPADQLPKDDEEDPLICPDVIVSDGGAAIRAQSGQDSSGLRYQISISNVARQCTAIGNGSFRLKVGVEGRVLLGPAGSPGNYGATLVTTVTRANNVVGKRSARVGAAIPSGQSGADFTHVEDGIVVPAGKGDVEIFVGLGGGGAAAPARRRR